MSPLLLPAYAVCGVTDIVIVNPARGINHVPNTVRTIWDWENDKPWVGTGVLLPLKLIAIPPATLGTIMFSEQFYDEGAAEQK